jgi:hypothetical protein
MKRIVNKSKSFKEAESWDIFQQVSMNLKQRMSAACQLKERFYGKKVKDVRAWHREK